MSNIFSLNKSVINEFHFDNINHQVDENRIIKLLGYEKANAPEPVIDSIQQSLKELQSVLSFTGGYKIFESDLVEIDKKFVKIGGITFDTGKIISFNLKGSDTIAIIVATIGDKVTNYLRNLLDNGEPLTGYIADQIASEIVESWVDVIESELEKYVNQSGFKITNRYSPGYCGWNVSDQHNLFSLLPEKFCGISLTESALMIPIKSVSAFVGIGKNVERKDYECSICDIEFCYKRVRNE
ncbi:MAG TPA: vitamin B12 dependent-methionine synthase activation domain-containing protein [Ignavibacteriaceae bacterium]|nr:vitamin B12 dependent-methionine synthase activation domain-containing protein [Ignavibacteriaceae bacterium]